MTAAKVKDVIARLPGCTGQAADAVSACTQVTMEDAPRLLKISKSEFPDIWIRLPRHRWPKSRWNIEDPVVPLERNVYGHRLPGLLRERQFEEVLLELGWWQVPNWECLFCSSKTRTILIGLRWWHQNDWKEAEYGSNVEEFDEQCRSWRNQHHFLTTCIWDALNVKVKWMQWLLRNIHWCLNHSFLLEQLKNYQDVENITQRRLRGPATLNGAVAQSFKPLLGWSSIQEGGLNQLDNYQKYGGKLSWNVQTWHEMVDLTFLVRDATCSSSHEMDTSLWQTFGKINFIHSSHKWLPTMLSCGKHGSALSLGFIPRLRFCWRFWGLEKSTSERNLVYLRKSNICLHQLDVQEADISISHFYRIRNWRGLICVSNARQPDCDGQAADAISTYTLVKMEDDPKLLRIPEFPKSECPDVCIYTFFFFWTRLPRHKWSGSFHGGGYALQDGNKEKLKVVGGRCKRDSKSCQRGVWVKSRARKKLILWMHKERKKVHFATRMDICHLKTRS